MVNQYIKQLVEYGITHHLLEKEDRIYTINVLLDIMKLATYEEPGKVEEIDSNEKLEKVLNGLLDDAINRGLLEEDTIVSRDLWDTRLMNALLPRPSQVIKEFWQRYQMSPELATDYYYDFSKSADYIRTYRVARDEKWVTNTEYGDIDITINLSKPEKDPKQIALEKTLPAKKYPKCLLCIENEGYAGGVGHPARQNLRMIPITIQGREWRFQYSPYVYYKEHCILLNKEHTPMKMNHDTFVALFGFVEKFPHYFLGSNADLPIVGGSILSHDHFQGGNYEFAMAKASMEYDLVFEDFEDIKAGIVKWPMSVIRLRGNTVERIIALCDRILEVWRGYTDESVYIYANTNGESHNTITPIVRMREGLYEIDLVLRNNITTKEHPSGLYHPWEQYHHIKKENIGLIEVMGLAVLPARLKAEMEDIKKAILEKKDLREDVVLSKHADWVDTIRKKYAIIDKNSVANILQYEIGQVFKEILECAGVYKRDETGRAAFLRFIDTVNDRTVHAKRQE